LPIQRGGWQLETDLLGCEPMKPSCRHSSLVWLLLIACGACGGPQTQNVDIKAPSGPTLPQPPTAERRPHNVASPNGTRVDPYFWLRDDKREEPEVLAYLNAENEYTRALLAPTTALRQELYDEMIARIQEDDSTVPTLDNGYWYYTRFEAGKEHPIHARKRGKDGAEEIILDANQAAQGHDFYSASGLEVSRDNNFLAYTEDTVGRRQNQLRIVDLRNNRLLPDTVKNIETDVVWANDNKTLLYVEKHPHTLLGYRVKRHVLGTDAREDALVFEEKDPSFYMSVGRTMSHAYLTISLESTVSTEMLIIDADQPASAPRVLVPRERDHEYQAQHLNGRWVIRSNWKAHNFRLLEASEASVGDRGSWRELVPHRDDVFIHDFYVYNDFIVISERTSGLRKVRVLPTKDEQKPFFMDADEPAYTMYAHWLPEADTKVVRYSYTSLTTPISTYEVDVATGERTLLKREPVLGDFDPKNYVTEYVHATARDGKKVPVSLVYRKGLVKDGSAPIAQYGYGSYGYSIDPVFRVPYLSLLDRGFVYAIAHVRGGQELGRAWYEDGKLLHKVNTFTDFIDVTHFLVAEKYGAKDKVFAMGGSAGGLLMGAIANMAPDDYRGIIAWVPFVDVVTTMLDDSIPLTSNEWDEWGDPKNKEHYDYMLSYSPYDNVKAQDYPAMLVLTGLWDSQVQYFEPAKWVAKLRATKTDKNPLLLHINMDAGHGGKSGRYQRYHETARDYAWMLHTLGQEDARRPRN
jgi:oligopeptidase B